MRNENEKEYFRLLPSEREARLDAALSKLAQAENGFRMSIDFDDGQYAEIAFDSGGFFLRYSDGAGWLHITHHEVCDLVKRHADEL